MSCRFTGFVEEMYIERFCLTTTPCSRFGNALTVAGLQLRSFQGPTLRSQGPDRTGGNQCREGTQDPGALQARARAQLPNAGGLGPSGSGSRAKWPRRGRRPNHTAPWRGRFGRKPALNKGTKGWKSGFEVSRRVDFRRMSRVAPL